MTLNPLLSPSRLVELHRVEEPEVRLHGVVCHVHARLVILQTVDDANRFDGFMAMRPESLLDVAVPEHTLAYQRALTARGGRDSAPSLAGATTLRELLQLLVGGDLVTLHDEDSSVCWVGRILEVDAESFETHLVQPNGAPRGGATFQIAEVKLVEWGTAYAEGVRLMEE